MTSRRVGGLVEGSEGSGPGARERRRHRVEARLEDLESYLHEGSTESLRARWAEELEHVHAEYLDDGESERAEGLRQRLVAELEHREIESMGPWVRRQRLAWARVDRDAVREQAAQGQVGDARAGLPELLRVAESVADRESGAAVLAEALELAHALARRGGHGTAATSHLERLQRLAERWKTWPVRQPLARALALDVEAQLGRGDTVRAQRRLAQLRQQAERALASEPERSALAEALLALHGSVEGPERAAIEQELAFLASRPGAAQEQRKAWAEALGRTDRPGRRTLRPPLELLRQRAYRSADVESLGDLYARLEQELASLEGSTDEVFGELREVARRAEADPALRLRFARRWLEDGIPGAGKTAAANDHYAYTWAHAAAERGELEGELLRGRCLATGRGVPRDRQAAAEGLRRAAKRGSDEAELLLRILGFERWGWLRYRYAVLTWGGLLLLVVHLLTQPWRFHPAGIVAYLALSLAILGGYLLLGAGGSWFGPAPSPEAPVESEDEGSYGFGRHVEAFERKPWRILSVATEDGFVLVPLTLVGINPWTAALAGLVFGLAHYPAFSLRSCMIKAIDYAAVALFILPWAGLWPVVVGHVLWDVGLLVLGSRGREGSTGHH